MQETDSESIVLDYLSAAFVKLDQIEFAKASDLEICAYLNARIHSDIERTHFAGADSGFEVLENKQGVCGGMVLALKELVNAIGLDAELAYMIGGDVAHSMLEVRLPNHDVLLDPYFGVRFESKIDSQPISINNLVDEIANNSAKVLYVNKKRMRDKSIALDDTYSETDNDKRIDYNFPNDYLELEGWGTANSGFVDFVEIELMIGQTLGNKDWFTPTSSEPQPHTKLAHARRADGRHLSWGYIMGQTGTGYHVQHVYKIKAPEAEKNSGHNRFMLRLGFSTCYADIGVTPVMTLRQITGGRGRLCEKLMSKNALEDGIYSPQVLQHVFTTDCEETIIVCHSRGDFVLSFISVEPF